MGTLVLCMQSFYICRGWYHGSNTKGFTTPAVCPAIVYQLPCYATSFYPLLKYYHRIYPHFHS